MPAVFTKPGFRSLPQSYWKAAHVLLGRLHSKIFLFPALKRGVRGACLSSLGSLPQSFWEPAPVFLGVCPGTTGVLSVGCANRQYPNIFIARPWAGSHRSLPQFLKCVGGRLCLPPTHFNLLLPLLAAGVRNWAGTAFILCESHTGAGRGCY